MTSLHAIFHGICPVFDQIIVIRIVWYFTFKFKWASGLNIKIYFIVWREKLFFFYKMDDLLSYQIFVLQMISIFNICRLLTFIFSLLQPLWIPRYYWKSCNFSKMARMSVKYMYLILNIVTRDLLLFIFEILVSNISLSTWRLSF